MDDALIDSLRRAVEASPADAELRLHLGELLLGRGETDEAVAHASAVLSFAPSDTRARALITRALAPPTAPTEPAAPTEQAAPTATAEDAPTPPPSPRPAGPAHGFDWHAAEAQVEGIAEPMFVHGGETDAETPSAFDVERSTVRLTDVGGMAQVKARLNSAFLAPLQNPELRKLYGKSLRGGLLMYGPPGCGKTFLARAVAGELGARFISVGLSDILDMYIGNSEQNVHDLFQLARREAPCVLFLDEIDAIGQRRSMTRQSGLRGVVVALLEELDGVANDNEGVFVLAATNQPWDVDPALRRPGRLDRTVLVLPPDLGAREAIFRYHFAHRPVEGIDAKALAQRSDGLSGADIAYVCELASEAALLDSVSSGTVRMITQHDALAALSEVKPSTTSWLDSARNVVMFGDDDGTFTELKDYLKKVKRL